MQVYACFEIQYSNPQGGAPMAKVFKLELDAMLWCANIEAPDTSAADGCYRFYRSIELE